MANRGLLAKVHGCCLPTPSPCALTLSLQRAGARAQTEWAQLPQGLPRSTLEPQMDPSFAFRVLVALPGEEEALCRRGPWGAWRALTSEEMAPFAGASRQGSQLFWAGDCHPDEPGLSQSLSQAGASAAAVAWLALHTSGVCPQRATGRQLLGLPDSAFHLRVAVSIGPFSVAVPPRT